MERGGLSENMRDSFDQENGNELAFGPLKTADFQAALRLPHCPLDMPEHDLNLQRPGLTLWNGGLISSLRRAMTRKQASLISLKSRA